MKEIINFSGYPVDLSRFNNSWAEVRNFVNSTGCLGVELLIGGEHDETVPRDLVTSVHLPGWLGWIRLWREPETIPADCDPVKLHYYYGGVSPEDLIRSFCYNLEKAASIGAVYAVFHITHIELDEFFTRKHRYTYQEVLSAAAAFVNTACKTYPGGEPPVTIAFENLWWPGLTFLSQEEVDFFISLLEFDNWIFVLDTGHMMNALQITSEQEGIEKVLSSLHNLSDSTLDRIRSVHFQCSVSGEYQKKHFFCDPPTGFADLSYGEQIAQLMPMVTELDQHCPFTNPDCSKILQLVKPEYVVHEFLSRSREEFENKIRTQKETLRNIHTISNMCNPAKPKTCSSLIFSQNKRI